MSFEQQPRPTGEWTKEDKQILIDRYTLTLNESDKPHKTAYFEVINIIRSSKTINSAIHELGEAQKNAISKMQLAIHLPLTSELEQRAIVEVCDFVIRELYYFRAFHVFPDIQG